MAMGNREALISKLIVECDKAKIDYKLMDAVFEVESAWNPWAVRFEPHFRYITNSKQFAKNNGISEATEITMQKISWGLGQVMGGTARGNGFTGPLNSLCDPKLGIEASVLCMKKLYARFATLDERISAYNAGTPIQDSNGKFKNQAYVDKVLRVYDKRATIS